MHYNAAHRNVCRECSRSFPTSHLLDVHLTEWHDAMFQVLAARQNMVLIETCHVLDYSVIVWKKSA